MINGYPNVSTWTISLVHKVIWSILGLFFLWGVDKPVGRIDIVGRGAPKTNEVWQLCRARPLRHWNCEIDYITTGPRSDKVRVPFEPISGQCFSVRFEFSLRHSKPLIDYVVTSRSYCSPDPCDSKQLSLLLIYNLEINTPFLLFPQATFNPMLLALVKKIRTDVFFRSELEQYN